MKDTNFCTIQGWMINKLKLKGNDLFIFAIIYGMTQKEGNVFNAPIQYLRDWTNLSEPMVIAILKNLVKMNFLIKQEHTGRSKPCTYWANLDYINQIYTGEIVIEKEQLKKVKLDNLKKLSTDNLKKLSAYNIYNNDNKIIDNTRSENALSNSSRVRTDEIFSKTLRQTKNEEKEQKKQIKNKAELLEKLTLDELAPEKFSDINFEEVAQNRRAAAERAAKKEASGRKALLANNKKARLNQAKALFPDDDTLNLLADFIDMYQFSFNILSEISWRGILDGIVQYADEPNKLHKAIKDSTTRGYRTIIYLNERSRYNDFDNTRNHIVDTKALHEFTEEEAKAFDNSLARDDDGNYQIF